MSAEFTAGYAAVGISNAPGSGFIVWGVGKTIDEAREDAQQWLDSFSPDLDDLTFEPISPAQYERIYFGEVAWPMTEAAS